MVSDGQYLNWISASPVARLDEFMVGMCVARLCSAQPRLRHSQALASAGAILVLASGYLFYRWKIGLVPVFLAGGFTTTAEIGMAALVTAAVFSKSWGARALSFRPLRLLGVMCFSIYVWHGILQVHGFHIDYPTRHYRLRGP